MIAGNFNATDNGDGTWLIQDVPVFCECKRGEDVYDLEWLERAFNRLEQAKDEGHRPPVHVYHHVTGEPKPTAAGMMSPKRIGTMRWRGVPRKAIFVDILITDEEVFQRIASKRLPYRSVEIYNGEIISCSLLDSEAPFIEMPMTTIRGADVAPATKAPFEASTTAPVLAFKKAGEVTHAITEFHMADDLKLKSLTFDAANTSTPFSWSMADGGITTSGDWPALKLFMEDGEEDEGSKSDEAEDMEAEGGPDAKAIVKAIESGDISISDFDAIKAAMDSRASGDDEAAEDEAPEGPPAPQEGPGELMQAPKGANFDADTHAELIAMKKRLDEKDADDGAAKFAKTTAAKFMDRNMGEGFEDEVKAFALEHGMDAAEATYAKLLDKVPPAAGPDFESAMAAQNDVPDEVRKFSHSREAGEAARKANDQYEQLKKFTRLSRERFIELALAEQGIATKA